MDNPQREILVTPEWPKLIDGLGYHWLILGGMPFMKDGKKFIKMKLKPDEIDKKRYNLRRGEELDQDENVPDFIVDELDLISLNPYDAANHKTLYVKSFRHEETDLSKYGEKLKAIIHAQKNDLLIKEGEILRLREQLEMAKLQTGKSLKEGAEIFKDTIEGYAKIIRQPEEKK